MSVKPYIYQFDNVRIEAGEFRVFKNGELIMLEPKAFQALIFLLEHRGRLVTKDELLDAVWKDSFVTPNVLTRIIAQLRHALGDVSHNSRYIETVPTRGYRFIHEVEETEAETSLLLATYTKTHTVTEETIEHEQAPTANKETAETLAEKTVGELVHFEHRNQTTTSFWKSRRGIILAVLLMTVTTAGVVYLISLKNWVQPKTSVDASERTLAVLPFKLLNPSYKSDYLSVGLADSLITKLSNVRSLTVRPTSAVMRYAPNEMDAAGVGRELKV